MNIVVDSKMERQTFDEQMKPLLIYKEAYDKAEAEYKTLAQQTEAFKDIANKELSPEAYSIFNKYSKALESATQDLSKGLSIKTRKDLIDLNKRFQSEIKPIADSHASLKEARDFRDKAPEDSIFEVSDYSSLDGLLHGKMANNNYISGKELADRASKYAASYAEANKNAYVRSVANNMYFDMVERKGLSVDEFQKALSQHPVVQNYFGTIKRNMMKELDMSRYDSKSREKINHYLNSGLVIGLTQTTHKYEKDPRPELRNSLQKAVIGAEKIDKGHLGYDSALKELGIGSSPTGDVTSTTPKPGKPDIPDPTKNKKSGDGTPDL